MKPHHIVGALVAFAFFPACGPSGRASASVPAPTVSMEKLVGRYVHSEGIKTIILKEDYGDKGWNGRLSFSPAVGDWKATLRCRVIGTDLIVEIPGKEATLVKMFILQDSETIIGRFSPWTGKFTRVRR